MEEIHVTYVGNIIYKQVSLMDLIDLVSIQNIIHK